MPYEEAHRQPKGPGDARPTALQVIKDANITDKLDDHTILITGGSSGLGFETAKALLTTGATVFITARTAEKGKEAADALQSTPTKGKAHAIAMELDSFASIRAGAADFLQQSNKLNILICNAGVMACPESRTKDGFEMQFGVNHLSHFLLFQLLKDTMVASSSADFLSRVVSLSSSGHRSNPPLIGDYNFDKTPYNPWMGYGQSKTANIYFASQIEARYGKQGIHGVSVHPGFIHTPLERHIAGDPTAKGFIANEKASPLWKSPEQGAATTVWAAVGTGWEGGRYLENVSVAKAFDPEAELVMHAPGYAVHAYDEAAAKQLWEDSLAFIAK